MSIKTRLWDENSQRYNTPLVLVLKRIMYRVITPMGIVLSVCGILFFIRDKELQGSILIGLGLAMFASLSIDWGLNPSLCEVSHTFGASRWFGIAIPKWLRNLKPRRNLKREFIAAAIVQQKLFPDVPSSIPILDIAARNLPAMNLTGDYYDFIPLDDNRIGIAIADACGKGMEAAILMVNARVNLRVHAPKHNTVENVVSQVNRALYFDTEAHRFVTFVYGVLDIQNMTYTYTNAGHNPPLFYNSRTRTVRFLSAGGPIAGVMPDSSYESECIQLSSSDVILFYTDGITESENFKKEVFSEEQLCQVLKCNAHLNAQELMEKVIYEVKAFTNESNPNDDATLVILKIV